MAPRTSLFRDGQTSTRPLGIARLRLQNLSKNWVDSRRLQRNPVDSVAARKRWYSRTLPTKDERHRLVTKYRFLGFESLSLRHVDAV